MAGGEPAESESLSERSGESLTTLKGSAIIKGTRGPKINTWSGAGKSWAGIYHGGSSPAIIGG